MAKHTLKILRREHRKIFKVCLAILQHMYAKVKRISPAAIATVRLFITFSCRSCNKLKKRQDLKKPRFHSVYAT